ncbi:PAS domain S-box-containing protein/diguanylate cyclase (GGDEF) domain-containing protein [Lentzea xinjiangensis]|uniref:PAS domain S-box-containing protein/diguanylate cyclase (GGDEF) domain-containing protein n=1 Tax=Lentzea xinjiangensis TaxID=402600 RepID=A0A1H9E7Q2_9PSEU|nr:diguanylate cyclase [Lentzea xinjiangensis]SEQ21622.1 PAS domain S-box-containing protein/diguanylate cyclase (GGDEF) domain-containing protein [Lentzea xinjiangensis]
MDRVPSQDDAGSSRSRRRDELAHDWAVQVSGTACIPFSAAKLTEELRELLNVVAEAVAGDPATAGKAGRRLVEMHCVGAESLIRSVAVLARFVAAEGADAERAALVIGALSAAYTGAIQAFVLEQQQSVSQALFLANRAVQLDLQASEERFEDVFAHSSTGIAMVSLDGELERANEALCTILRRDDVAGMTLGDLIAPADLPLIEDALASLCHGRLRRVEERPRLIDRDGEHFRVLLAATVQKDADDKPLRHVVLIEDDSQLTLLGGRLQYQSLHDALTGLPNRQYLTTRLESLLHSDVEHGVTLYHLDLDAFAVITDGLGREVGDGVLRLVAERLSSVFSREKAMVARLEGDEFAVLVENGPDTPDVGTTIRAIEHELAEPVYFGDHGVAVSATIGVLPRLHPGDHPAEVLRTSDMTLRRAKRTGRRQWGLHDATQDKREREDLALAAVMPGAWESGDIEVVFAPVMRLDGSARVCVEAELSWRHRDAGLIPHGKCVSMAENTGLMLPLGEWMLHRAAEAATGHDELLAVCLTASLANSPDLVRDVRRVLADTGLRAERLLLGFPMHVLASEDGEAADNLQLISEMGIHIGARDFSGSTAEIELVRSLGVRAVRVQGRSREPDELVSHVLSDLIGFVHEAGGLVVVDAIEDAEQRDWWKELGADAGVGPVFCERPATRWPGAG